MSELIGCQNLKALAIEASGRERTLVRLRCKQWTCPYCAERNRAMWRAILLHHINHQVRTTWSWFTLTAHRYARGEQKSLSNLRGGWDLLMKRMKRRYGKFQYARVFEKHADGSYHIHAIADFNFDDIVERQGRDGKKTNYSRWLQKTAWSLGLGMYTHADNVEACYEANAGYVAAYITKYIVKLDVATKNELGRVRHIQVSQGWLRKEIDSSVENWRFAWGVYYEDILKAMASHKYVDSLDGHVVTIDDFEDTYIYPPEFDFRNGN